MKIYKVSVSDKVFEKVRIANGFFSRFKGLMFEEDLNEGEGLLLKKCKAIHTLFMNFDIDVAYLDINYVVLGKETLKPWRIGKSIPGVKHVFEAKKDSMKEIKIGDMIKILKIRGENNE